MVRKILDYPRKALDSAYRIFNGSLRGDFIQTYTGKEFYPLDPIVADIDLWDIAHALSMLCRWNGTCHYFYSIAEHSVRVARVLKHLSPRMRLTALFHDASEAYLSDITSPVKRSKYLRGYRKLERNMMRAISERFDLIHPLPYKVREADGLLLGTEARDLFPSVKKNWHLRYGALPQTIVPWDQPTAKQQFISEYYSIIEEMDDESKVLSGFH